MSKVILLDFNSEKCVTAIDRIHKWRLINYSFVLVLLNKTENPRLHGKKYKRNVALERS